MIHLISPSITAVSLVLWAFNFGLWRFMPRFLAPKPDLNGTWKVEIRPTPSSGTPLSPITGFMFVKQSYSSLSMRLETEDTTSELEAEQITISKSNHYQLWAVYYCQSRIPGKIPHHYGAMMMIYQKSRDGVKLDGHFWIDGELKDAMGRHLDDGLLRLSTRRRKRYASFDDARKNFK